MEYTFTAETEDAEFDVKLSDQASEKVTYSELMTLVKDLETRRELIYAGDEYPREEYETAVLDGYIKTINKAIELYMRRDEWIPEC